jgi:hypothetical protein
MKKAFLLLPMLLLCLFIYAQSWNITGNAGTNPAVHFLGTTDQATLVFRVHNRYSGEIDSVKQKTFFGYGAGINTTGIANTAFGFKSLYFNTTGVSNTAQGGYSLYSNTTGNSNTACGYSALYSNTTGTLNTAVGSNALLYNTTGSGNTASGSGALLHNTTGYGNTADGRDALASSTTGSYNTASGMMAMNGSNTSSYNTAMGYGSMVYATTGNYNVGVGLYALYSPYASQYNVAIGANAGINYAIGWNNTLIGANTNVNANDRYNCIALGQDIVCTANSQARIGNLATNSIGGYTTWSNFSDGRYKKDVTANVKGIDFIMRLQPITYHLDASGLDKKLHEGMKREKNEFTEKGIAEKEKVVFSGFIAQDVEKAANEVGYDFSGVDKPQNKDDFYGLRYADFVVPLVKATQEQQQTIEELVKQGAQLQQRLEQLEKNAGKKPGVVSPDLLTVWPNPSEGILFISISTAEKTTVVISVIDAKGAVIKKEQKQLVSGENQFTIDIKGIANGMYTVSAEWSGGKMKKSAQVLKQQ